jgi:rubrerythrin
MRDTRATYRRFIDFEEQAAEIYLRMASRFSPENMELSAFWLEMGMQEKQHAGLLQFCVAEELFASELPEESEIQQAQNLLAELKRRASDPDLTTDDAFEIAAEMETSEINAIYDRLTTPVHASTYLLRRKIATSLPGHVGELLQQARKFHAREETLAVLERLAARHAH